MAEYAPKWRYSALRAVLQCDRRGGEISDAAKHFLAKQLGPEQAKDFLCTALRSLRLFVSLD